MENRIDKKPLRKKHDEYYLIYALLFCSVVLRYFTFFQSLLSTSLNFLTSVLSYSLAGLGILLFIVKTMGNVKENRAFYIWIVLSFYMLTVGLLRSNMFTSHLTSNNFYFMFQDVAYIFLFATGAVYANRRGMQYYHRLMVLLSIGAIVCGVFSIFTYDFNVSRIIYRGDSLWTISYFLWWPSCAFFAYMFCYARITGKYRIVGYVLFALFMLMGLLFQKRGTILEGVFLYFFVAIVRPIRNKTRGIALLSRVATIVVTLVVAFAAIAIMNNIPYLEKVAQSFSGRLVQSADSEARVTEFTTYVNEAKTDELLLGQGAGNYFTTSLRYLNAVHIGFANALYKGGIFYLLFDIWIIFAAVRMLFKYKRLSDTALVCLCVTLGYLVTSTHDAGWSYTMGIFGYATPICYVLQYNEDTDRSVVLG